jgi:hypothetical protein
MRKRKYVIGVIAGVVASLAVSGIAQGATKQTLTVTVGASKQDAKLRGPADINVTVDTDLPAGTNVFQTAQQTVLTFDGDFDLGNTAKYPTCDPAVLAGTTTAGAAAACGPGSGKNSQVGSGNSTVCGVLFGCAGGQIPGVVTAFNGIPSGGNPQIILHNRIGPPINVTTVLQGVLSGSTLTVSVPDTSATGNHLTHFFTGVPILKTGTGVAASAAKKKKKKKAAPIYYITAKCSDGTWSTSETTTFRAGGATLSASTTTPCTKKPAKKKKKKK